MPEYSFSARDNMIKSQLMPNRVVDGKLLSAIASVPREMFVLPQYSKVAYVDEDVAVGGGRFLTEPVAFARLLQLAGITAEDKVLEIGGATGYSAAIISRLANHVVMVEEDYDLLEKAVYNLNSLGITNVKTVHASLEKGEPGDAPYDVIFICGAVDRVPNGLIDQLAIGGRLVCVTSFEGVKRASIYSRTPKGISVRDDFEAQIREMPGFETKKEFEF